MRPLIAEELLVLGYDPDGIARGDATCLDAALAGALIVELMLGGSLVADGDRLSAVAGADTPGHPELANGFTKIAAGQAAEAAIVTLVPGLRHRLLAGLVAQGVLADEVHRWLGVLQRHRFPELDQSIRANALRRLKAPADPRSTALAATVVAAGLADRVWSADELRDVRQQLSRFPEGALVSDAVAKAVGTMHARTMT